MPKIVLYYWSLNAFPDEMSCSFAFLIWMKWTLPICFMTDITTTLVSKLHFCTMIGHVSLSFNIKLGLTLLTIVGKGQTDIASTFYNIFDQAILSPITEKHLIFPTSSLSNAMGSIFLSALSRQGRRYMLLLGS